MGDIRCAKCGEPWESYGVYASLRDEGDMTPEEARRFLKGEGCPCCDFGKKGELNGSLEDFLTDAFNETDEDPVEVLERVCG